MKLDELFILPLLASKPTFYQMGLLLGFTCLSSVGVFQSRGGYSDLGVQQLSSPHGNSEDCSRQLQLLGVPFGPEGSGEKQLPRGWCDVMWKCAPWCLLAVCALCGSAPRPKRISVHFVHCQIEHLLIQSSKGNSTTNPRLGSIFFSLSFTSMA